MQKYQQVNYSLNVSVQNCV